MKLTKVEKKEKNQMELHITVEPEAFEAACEKAYHKNVGSINIQGFRKGHAPRKLIEKMFGNEIFFEDAMNFCIPDAYDAAVVEAELDPIDQPALTDFDVKDGVFTFVAVVPVKPEVTLKDYKGLSAERADDTVSEEEISAELERLRERNARQVAVDRAAAEGDTVMLDFEGSVDGVPFDGGKGENFALELGSGTFIPGFEEQLVGMKAGEERDVNVTFPAEYGEKSLAGKAAVFKCKINEVKEKQKPDLDDEFAKDVSEFDTMDALKADLQTRMEAQKKSGADNDFQEKLMDQITAEMEGDIPDKMVENQLDNIVSDFGYRLAMQGLELKAYLQMQNMEMSAFRGLFKDQALRQVKTRLALEKIAVTEKLEVAEEELEAEYKRLAEQNQMEIEKVRQYLAAAELKKDLLVQKAAEVVKSSAKALKLEKKAETEEAAEKPAKKKTSKKAADTEEAPAAEEKPAKEKKSTAKKATNNASEAE